MRRKPRGLMTTVSPPDAPTAPAGLKTTPDASPRALYVLLLVVFINLVGFGLVIPLLPFSTRAARTRPCVSGCSTWAPRA